MRPTLILQPIHNSSTDILRTFAEGKPLSAEQTHFLEWHKKQLSSQAFDPVLKYYLEANKHHHPLTAFLPFSDDLNPEEIKKLKERIQKLIQKNATRVFVTFTQKQFLHFKSLAIHELIFWHGNQFLTGAPFFPGGTPPVIYFQWGNLFGVVKYVILPGEKALKANTLVYFEDLEERDLNVCVAEYEKHFKQELTQQQVILEENKIDPLTFNQFLIRTPSLKLEPWNKNK